MEFKKCGFLLINQHMLSLPILIEIKWLSILQRDLCSYLSGVGVKGEREVTVVFDLVL